MVRYLGVDVEMISEKNVLESTVEYLARMQRIHPVAFVESHGILWEKHRLKDRMANSQHLIQIEKCLQDQKLEEHGYPRHEFVHHESLQEIHPAENYETKKKLDTQKKLQRWLKLLRLPRPQKSLMSLPQKRLMSQMW